MTETVSVVDAVDGLVIASSSMLTWWPAGIVWPPLRPHVATSPDLPHDPTIALPASTSRTKVLPAAARLVPAGKVIVIWLTP